MPPSSPPRALLFDLGGVLIDIDFGRAFEHWARCSPLSADELRARFRIDAPYEQHERGELAAADYFAHLARLLRLDASLQEIELGWNAIFIGEIEATRRRVARLPLPRFAFTNTNATHMAAWTARYPDVVAAFDGVFASHELGLRKPEAAAFAAICQRTGFAAPDILFFDDSLDNVEGARRAGLRAVQVNGPQDVADVLHTWGWS